MYFLLCQNSQFPKIKNTLMNLEVFHAWLTHIDVIPWMLHVLKQGFKFLTYINRKSQNIFHARFTLCETFASAQQHSSPQ